MRNAAIMLQSLIESTKKNVSLTLWADELFVATIESIVCVRHWRRTAIEHWIHCRDVGHILIKYKRTQKEKNETSQAKMVYGSASITIFMIRIVIAAAFIIIGGGSGSISNDYSSDNLLLTTTRTEERQIYNTTQPTTHNQTDLHCNFHFFYYYFCFRCHCVPSQRILTPLNYCV